MAAQGDFWGEIAPAQVRTPVSIMREQAALLGKKTQNLIEAVVKTRTTPFDQFTHSFLLLVPPLDGYQYELFRIEHGVEMYPVTVAAGLQVERLDNEQQFVDWLKRKLSDPETKQLIGNLLGMVTK